MQDNIKKIFCSLSFAAVFLLVVSLQPKTVLADTSMNISNFSVTQAANSYVIHATLQTNNVLNFTGLSFVGIIDSDEINPPFQVVGLPLQPQNGAMTISMVSNSDPVGHFFQFFLLDSASLEAEGGNAAFNPANGSAYSVYIPSQIWHYTGNDSNPSNPTDPSNPSNPTDPNGNINNIVNPPCENSVQPPCVNIAPEIQFQPTSTIGNPLNADFDIIGFLKKLFNNFVKIMIPIIVLLMIYSGFLFVEARGNEEKLSVAKKNFLYVIIGAVVVFGAWTIATVLDGTVHQLSFVIQNLINLV